MGDWRSRKVFLTGHTGFKGAWLTLLLQRLGASVTGYALEPPTRPSLFEKASVDGVMTESVIGDVRDLGRLRLAMAKAEPEVVFHLAAQALVRASYDDPVGTFQTNIMGTVNVLEAVRHLPSVRALVIATSDKCYANHEWIWGYREIEPMGGHDPYSSSKGCAEIVAAAYRNSFFGGGAGASRAAVATARAGNVIGGGDWAADRLVPDLIRSIERGEPLLVRAPASLRPWQHVLDPLNGYVHLAEALLGDGTAYAEAWNFGPRDADALTVEDLLRQLIGRLGRGAWRADSAPHPHEAKTLRLDISKAQSRLGWTPRWALSDALDAIAEWYRGYWSGAAVNQICLAQVDRILETTPRT